MPFGVMRTGLWAHPDFRRLWAAETVSVFGSLVTRTALPFAAILTLGASPGQLALLAAAELVPGFAAGLFAGVWVDRLRRRPIMVWTDLARAALLATVPAAAWLDVLRMEHLYAVAALGSVLTVGFDVAYRAYLPTLVTREELLEGNSKLTASASVAEFAAFGSGGWLVQWLTAPVAILADAATFVWSAVLVARIRAPEPPPPPPEQRTGVVEEIRDGLRLMAGDARLRALGLAAVASNLSFRVTGTVFLLYVTRDLGLAPGVQGLIYAIGGGTSLVGAVLVGRVNRRLGIGPTMVGALVMVGLGMGLVPAAGWGATTAVAVAFLVGQQLLSDGAATAYDVNETSLLQTMAPERLQGRVIASMRSLAFGGMLAGALVGGVLGELIGLRGTLWVGTAGMVLSALPLLRSPVSRLRVVPDG